MSTAKRAASREFHLVARPQGEPTPDHFALVERQLRPPAAGEVLARNTHLSVDPYLRGRMDDAESYIAPFPLDGPLDGAAVGEVVESVDDRLVPGDVVTHWHSWRELVVGPADEFELIEAQPLRRRAGMNRGLPPLQRETPARIDNCRSSRGGPNGDRSRV
jgi:NADPH-dependent curcumin reductase CurA